MIAYCGLDCEQCEAYLATQNNDDSKRAEVAKKWAEIYNAPIKPEHINCTGCLSDGVKTYFCEAMCEIRKCAREKAIQHCSQCETYPCDRLEEIFIHKPEARRRLDELRHE